MNLNIPKIGTIYTLDQPLDIQVWGYSKIGRKLNPTNIYSLVNFTIPVGADIQLVKLHVSERGATEIIFKYDKSPFTINLDKANEISYSKEGHITDNKIIVNIKYPYSQWGITKSKKEDLEYVINGKDYREKDLINFKPKANWSRSSPTDSYGKELTRAYTESIICEIHGLKKKDCIFKKL